MAVPSPVVVIYDARNVLRCAEEHRDKDKFPRSILEHIVKSFRLVSRRKSVSLRFRLISPDFAETKRKGRKGEGGEDSIDAISSLREAAFWLWEKVREGSWESREEGFNLIPLT